MFAARVSFCTAVCILVVLCCKAVFGIKAHFASVCLGLSLYVWGVRFCGMILQPHSSRKTAINLNPLASRTVSESCRLNWIANIRKAYNLATKVRIKRDENFFATLPGTFADTLLAKTLAAMMPLKP